MSITALRAEDIVLTPGKTEVVVAPRAPSATYFAAEEMTNFLSHIFGSAVPLRVRPSGNEIVSVILGTNGWAMADGVNLDTLPRDTYRIKTVPGRVYVAGCDDPHSDIKLMLRDNGFELFERATVFAAYDFLERFAGVRFYFPGELGEIVPRAQQIVVPASDLTCAPKWTQRSYYMAGDGANYEGCDAMFGTPNSGKRLQSLRLRYQTFILPCCHGQNFFKITERFGAKHPEYLQLREDGTRCTNLVENKAGDCNKRQLCHSSGVYEEFYQDVRACFRGESADARKMPSVFHPGTYAFDGSNFRRDRDGTCYADLMPQDGMFRCTCPKCKAAYVNDPVDWASELVWGRVAEVARRIQNEGLTGKITLMAYPPYRRIPALDLPSNIMVMVAEQGPWMISHPEDCKTELKRIRAWSEKLGHKIWIWTYPQKYGYFGKSVLDIPQHAPHAWLKYYKAASPWIFGAFAESESDRWIYNYLNYRLFMRYAWNGEIDVNRELAEHHRLMFGEAAADTMGQFYNTLEKLWMSGAVDHTYASPIGPVIWPAKPQKLWIETYSPAALEGLNALLNTAASKTSPSSLEARRVEFIRHEFYAPLRKRCEQKWKELGVAFTAAQEGYADERGRFITTAGAKTGDDATHATANGWGLKPLGAPGGIKVSNTFKNKPEYRKAPVRQPILPFWTANVRGVVVAPKDDVAITALADECAWHLAQMVGAKVDVVAVEPDDAKPAIVFARGDKAAFIRCEGTHVKLGGNRSAASHALTYFLEALGCRYLWPGKSGKVIPKCTELHLPEINWSFEPVLKIRGIRVPSASTGAFRNFKTALGIDGEDYGQRFTAASIDRAGNRDFFAWHGVNEPYETAGEWNRGHYYQNYYSRYGKDHPDWFALQPNGSRVQDLGPMPERATLCLSNPELVREVARRRLEDFKTLSWYETLSIELPDGGYMGQCLCENCRKMDPVNAPAVDLIFPKAFNGTRRYVSLTDRVVMYANRVMAEVAKEMPEKRLTISNYSCYDAPPVSVRPDARLVIDNAAGDYSNAKFYNWARDSVAQWSHFDNPIVWRPNLMMALRLPVPQNYARRLVDDFETFKANGLVGTDFDCMAGHWASEGLNYYMAAKCHLNPDHLSYDDLLDDYCRAGFGDAAPEIRNYFNAVERLTEEAAKVGQGIEGYVKLFNDDELAAWLKAAARKVANNPVARARVKFLARGVSYARAERELENAWTAAGHDETAKKAAKERYLAFVRAQSEADPIATMPISLVNWFTKYLRR